MQAAEIQNLEVQFSHDLVQYWGWFLALGVGLLALGVAAVARAVTATVVSMVFFGWLLVLAGAIEVVQAVAVGHWAGFFQHLFAAVLFLVAGFIMVFRPLITAEVLTLFMALFFLIGGLFQLIGAAWIGLPGWGWSAVDGVITFVLGLLVLAQWPASGFMGDRPPSWHRSHFLRPRLDRDRAQLARRVGLRRRWPAPCSGPSRGLGTLRPFRQEPVTDEKSLRQR